MSYLGIRWSIRVSVGCACCLMAAGLRAQSLPADQDLIASMQPMSDVAGRLRLSYGKVVTYEDGLWEWPGEMRPTGPNSTGRGALVHSALSFNMPGEAVLASDLPTRITQILDAYHRQTDGPRFRIVTSSYGLHIVPLQVRDHSGNFVPAKNALDEPVFIPLQERTAHEHLLALRAAVAAGGQGLQMFLLPQVVNIHGLDATNYLFAPTPAENRPFVWGTARSNVTAREALIDLLGRSATTFVWDLRCRRTASEKYNLCALILGPLEVTTVGADGKPAKQAVRYDRCGGCGGGRVLPAGRGDPR